jgi:hypothetical protein
MQESQSFGMSLSPSPQYVTSYKTELDQEYNILLGNGMKVMSLVPRLVAGLLRIASSLTRVTNCSADIETKMR